MVNVETIVERAVAAARGLGFAFLVYFLTAFLRDAGGFLWPGAGVVAALTDRTDGRIDLCLLISVATMALAVLLVRLYSRTHAEADRPVPLLRLDPAWWREWVRGLLLGAGLASLAVAPAVAAGQVEIAGLAAGAMRDPLLLLIITVILALEAAREELGFRGPAQRELTRAVTFPIAAIALGGSFAIVHGGNPSVGRIALVGIFVAAALALAGLARARGDLGMVCGVHAAWNITLGLVWSVPVSGLQLHTTLLETSARPSLWTGGSFGAEAGIPAIGVLALFAFITWRLPPAT